jgi:hypothetical protein
MTVTLDKCLIREPLSVDIIHTREAEISFHVQHGYPPFGSHNIGTAAPVTKRQGTERMIAHQARAAASPRRLHRADLFLCY